MDINALCAEIILPKSTKSRIRAVIIRGMHEVFLSIGVPVICALILAVLRSIATQDECSLITFQDVSIDMTFLAMGAAGSISKSPVLVFLKDYRPDAFAILLLFDFLIATFLLYCRRYKPANTSRRVFFSIAVGSFPLLIVTAITFAQNAGAK